uniref:Transferrin receptor-like dimerisation domain-containing protein n=1 Tax=Spongospora subterranea TaxID=70186 RepID=A0A0H5QIN9_9EUKA|eukprot:CRZ01950.1 hypothetical protein [Spongospora subterranea]
MSMVQCFVDVLPLRLREYAEALSVYIDKLASEVSTVHADMPRLRSIASKFEQAAGVVDDVAASLDNLAVPSEKELAQVNDRLAFLERRFLLDRPLPDRDEMYYRHAVYAPGLYTGYGASVLPGIRYAFTTNNTSLQSEQIQILYERIQDAIGFLCLPQS